MEAQVWWCLSDSSLQASGLSTLRTVSTRIFLLVWMFLLGFPEITSCIVSFRNSFAILDMLWFHMNQFQLQCLRKFPQSLPGWLYLAWWRLRWSDWPGLYSCLLLPLQGHRAAPAHRILHCREHSKTQNKTLARTPEAIVRVFLFDMKCLSSSPKVPAVL